MGRRHYKTYSIALTFLLPYILPKFWVLEAKDCVKSPQVASRRLAWTFTEYCIKEKGHFKNICLYPAPPSNKGNSQKAASCFLRMFSEHICAWFIYISKGTPCVWCPVHSFNKRTFLSTSVSLRPVWFKAQTWRQTARGQVWAPLLIIGTPLDRFLYLNFFCTTWIIIAPTCMSYLLIWKKFTPIFNSWKQQTSMISQFLFVSNPAAIHLASSSGSLSSPAVGLGHRLIWRLAWEEGKICFPTHSQGCRQASIPLHRLLYYGWFSPELVMQNRVRGAHSG